MNDDKKLDPGLSGYISTNAEIFSMDFMAEVRELVSITELPGFADFLQRFTNYPGFLKTRNKSGNPLPALLKASGGTRIIDTSTTSNFVLDSLFTSHFSACCCLFNGSNLRSNQFNSDDLYKMAQQYLAPFQQANDKSINTATLNLHAMDIVRTMQLLRSLNLITKKSENYRQLALGAGSGTKDMYSLHQLPMAVKNKNFGEISYNLTIEQKFIEHIVITDLDESRDELYYTYNKQAQPPVYAVSSDMMDLLSELPHLNLKKRNLVTAIRIDHRMIPNVPGFLGMLSKSIDSKCDLIMSMGAGNTIEEFKGRINKLFEIFTALEDANLQPVLLKMHGPGSIEEQHASLRYGNPSNSTFQILYCNIKRENLSKAFL